MIAGVVARVRVYAVVFRHVRTFRWVALSFRYERLVHIAVRALFDRTVLLLDELRRAAGQFCIRDRQAGRQWQDDLRYRVFAARHTRASGRSCRLLGNRELARVVAGKLQLQWSPEQIAGWLKHSCAINKDYQVSQETIYRSFYIQARGALKRELLEHLRRTRAMRRSRHHTMKTDDHGRIRDAVSISERPATAHDRAIPGHWEGDLLFGNANSQIATLVERQTRYVMLVKIASKDTETVVNALIKHAGKLPEELYRSLTWDRGKEMAGHKRFTVATDIKVYFCDPQHPWQRGSNENTNGLLRQYFPKGIDLSGYSQARLNAVARRLNERPRKTLDFDTPAERFQQAVASTG